MKFNPLYGVLNQLVLFTDSETLKFKLLNQITPIFDRTLANAEYCRLELPLIDIASNDFVIHEMHISIFKYVNYNCPTLGPSHFTVLFLDSSGQLFRMHLFLNQLDNLACPPSWEKQLKDSNTYVKVDPPLTITYLTHSIYAHALPYLQELRKSQKEMEVKLSKEYEDLEHQAALLSDNLDENKDVYLARCEAIIKTVSALTEISASLYWPRMITYFKKLHKLVSSMPQPRAKPIEVKSSPKNVHETRTAKTTKCNQIHSNSTHSQQLLFSKPNTVNTKFIETNKQIHCMNALLDKLSHCKDTSMKALYLNDLNNQLIAIDLEKDDSLTCMQLQTLSTIEKKVSSLAKSTLETALIKEEYDLARLLSAFYSLVNGDIILALALVQKKATLLDFLFETLGLSINSSTINIRQKTYTNAVEYCFLESSTNDALADCFSVLIKHGADLMQLIGVDKLPLAHQILSAKPTHPLFSSLEKNRKLTLDNKLFYNQLIQILNTCLVSHNYEEHQYKEIEACLLNYRQNETAADLFSELLPSNQVLCVELSEIRKQHLSKAMLEALHEDDEISKEIIELQKESKQIIKNTQIFLKKTGTKFAFQSRMGAHVENYKQELLKANLTIDMDFSVLKTSILRNISDQRLNIALSEELMIVQIAILQTPHVMGKKNKKLKQLEVQQQQLLKQIEELSTRMPETVIKKYNDYQENLNKLMDFDSPNGVVENLTELTKLFNSIKTAISFEDDSQEKLHSSFYNMYQT